MATTAERLRKANPVDVHVGQRVRMRRMALKLSQESLGEKLRLTFQQVQKYEKGVNRIGAGRLQQIAGILEVPISFFYEGLPNAESNGETPPANEFNDFLCTAHGIRAVRAMMRIRDAALLNQFAVLLERVAGVETSA
jgi:transcriptional regulator with XRE-family HTH domain